MPELPEVETIANDLQQRILKKKITHVEVRLPKIIKGSAKLFVSTLQNNMFIKVRRRAKFLIFTLTSGELVLIHLRMTGQLIYWQKDKVIAGGHGHKQDLTSLLNKHTHVIINFTDGSRLFFNDLRQFGFMQLVKPEKLDQELRNFGQEPLHADFTLPAFRKMIVNRKTKVKAFLLNQKHVAGLGNIYADEVLFAAQVLPTRNLTSLTDQEIKRIHAAIKKILTRAILYRGTTFNDYRDASGRQGNFLAHLKVYARVGKKCLRCKQGVIQKRKLAGRGTSYCSHCQF